VGCEPGFDFCNSALRVHANQEGEREKDSATPINDCSRSVEAIPA